MAGRQVLRRDFLKTAGLGTVGLALSCLLPGCESGQERPSILFITADDMNWDSLGVTGCKVPDITPNIDRLASEGLRFTHAHVNIAVCQPCRESILTGRYPHNNGALGFDPIRADVPTLNEQLHRAGYMNGILGKTGHYKPPVKFCWDFKIHRKELLNGRDPDLYSRFTKAFLSRAKVAQKPFFLHVNSHDPHRPFEKARKKSKYPILRAYRPREVAVPGFLPDIPKVRQEVAWYFNSVHRCDETVGKVLRALEESGLAGNTLVLFMSDHGMAFPFAKTNCYLNSTRTPLIVRWPGRCTPGTVDREHLVSGVDIMPTLLEAAGLNRTKGLEGRSFCPLLLGRKYEGCGTVFTVFNRTAKRRDYPMRCIMTRKHAYIYNPWSDGKTVFRNESQAGLTMKAMMKAAAQDRCIAERVKLFLYRVPEEFYDLEKDPDALHNLVKKSGCRERVRRMRLKLLEKMKSTSDPLLGRFKEFCSGH